MLNTAWEDDGEALNAPKWHGHAWAAECAWTGSATSPKDFNRRIGAVLFGEKGDRFGATSNLRALAIARALDSPPDWREVENHMQEGIRIV